MKERSPNLIFYQKGDVSSISLTATYQGLHRGKKKYRKLGKKKKKKLDEFIPKFIIELKVN